MAFSVASVPPASSMELRECSQWKRDDCVAKCTLSREGAGDVLRRLVAAAGQDPDVSFARCAHDQSMQMSKIFPDG